MPHSVASDLGLHCLPITLLGVSRLNWVKETNITFHKCCRKREYPYFSDDDSDSDVCIIEDMESKMSYLKQMFPSKADVEIRKALMDVKGDQETAFDVLMGAGKTYI